ncbi:LacI family DNA-binding transcriptional regulator [Rhodococcus qingshengii]|uniref:LacI family DNA-binding transcriptional regulator n=1 Tax=Rhodococcus qingshengii TaxID=334542 RepID=A0AAW6LLR6_RHOSG|nr:LacI family DNA-binding transcriptional regulator [Rhodococcus qingshengii]MDE8647469.1 LacI family DNA-binding transcriptional regulator [Rhodococcus qingshengii]
MKRATTDRAATSADVAKHAGVSRTTVSMVINNNAQSLSESTRNRVLASIDALNYVPNKNAQLLRVPRRDTVLLPMPAYYNVDIFKDFKNTLRQQLPEFGLSLTVFTDDSTQGIQSARRWMEHHPQVVLTTPHECDRATAKFLKEHGVQVLLIAPNPVRYAPTLSTKLGLGRAAADYLIGECGHSDVCYWGPDDAEAKDISAVRFDEFQTAAHDYSVDVSSTESALAYEPMLDIAEKWKSEGTVPTAVYCFNDNLAIALVQVLSDLSLKVPEDVSVLGNDNSPLTAIVRPRVSSISIDVEELAFNVARDISRLIDKKKSVGSRPRSFSAEVTVRDSTRPLSRRGSGALPSTG